MERSKETAFKYTAKNNHLVCRVQQCRTRVSMQLLPCCWRVVPVSDQTQRRHLHSIPKADTTHTKVMLMERCCHTRERESVCVAATTGTKCNSSTGRMQKTANLQNSNDRSSLRWRFASNDPPPASAVKSIACYRSRVRRKMLPCCRSPVMSSVAVPCEDFAPEVKRTPAHSHGWQMTDLCLHIVCHLRALGCFDGISDVWKICIITVLRWVYLDRSVGNLDASRKRALWIVNGEVEFVYIVLV